jgi:hypothetical protein
MNDQMTKWLNDQKQRFQRKRAKQRETETRNNAKPYSRHSEGVKRQSNPLNTSPVILKEQSDWRIPLSLQKLWDSSLHFVPLRMTAECHSHPLPVIPTPPPLSFPPPPLSFPPPPVIPTPSLSFPPPPCHSRESGNPETPHPSFWTKWRIPLSLQSTRDCHGLKPSQWQ